MFAIKVIQNAGKENEEELLYQAEYVERRRKASLDGEGAGVRLVDISGSKGNAVHFSGPDTTIFVMNEQGATVARYEL